MNLMGVTFEIGETETVTARVDGGEIAADSPDTRSLEPSA
jgi:hypothetical protein